MASYAEPHVHVFSKEFNMKTWFITGISSGFGNELAKQLLSRGDRVAGTVRDRSGVADLQDQHGDRLWVAELDLVDGPAIAGTVERAFAELGRIDVVVNNAGYGHFGMVEELTEREIRQQIETNFFGALWVTQAVLPVFRRQRGGHLLQVTSEGGVRAFPGIGAYHASKWALEGLSESLRQEVATFGIRVTCVEPGPYATEWLSRGSRHSSRLADYDDVRAATAAEFQVGDPEATKAAILQLVDSDEPPARLLMGRTFPEIEKDYAERLDTWRRWQPVSLAAFGNEQHAAQ
jgi:NAD(P)-dependent dehydrogenase (short-subunit alcohol dehydrogenase family)